MQDLFKQHQRLNGHGDVGTSKSPIRQIILEDVVCFSWTEVPTTIEAVEGLVVVAALLATTTTMIMLISTAYFINL